MLLGYFKCALPSMVVAVVVVTPMAPASGQRIDSPQTRPASFERVESRGRGEQVQFLRQPPRVGDQIEQSITFQLRLKSTVRQGERFIQEATTETRRSQQRRITATDVSGDRTTAVKLRYESATTQTAHDDQPTATDQLPPPELQPVHGKVYHCRREGERLIVTDEAGNIPPLEEYQIVSENMVSLGRVNPLAQFLVGRTVSVGQQIELPREIGKELLGLSENYGEITLFQLALREIRMEQDMRCAVFDAQIEAASTDSSQLRLQLAGPMVIQTDTCRPVSADLLGPIGMVETRGSLNHTYQISGTGRMSVRFTSLFHDTRR